MNPMFQADNTFSSERYQVKVRPCIVNESNGPLDLSITKTENKSAALRLLVTADRLPGSWNPPPATAAAGDWPVQVTWEGKTFWSIAPNIRGDATLLSNGFWDGFATSWQDTELTTEERVFYRPVIIDGSTGRAIQEANLVFNVPPPNDAKVHGLALVDPSNLIVIAVAPAEEWGEPTGADNF